MATEDDNFDIDIYGDGGGYNTNDQADFKQDDTDLILDVAESVPEPAQAPVPQVEPKQSDSNQTVLESAIKPATETSPSTHNNPSGSTQSNTMPQTVGPHGVKRKDYEGRPHPDATTALLISDLQWWITDDAIRAWANEAACENELKDVTFSEHKVNGKSKGQAFVEFSTPAAAATTKTLIESNHKFNISFTNPHSNPFRTLPKDTPVRRDGGRGGMSGGFTNNGHAQNQNFSGGMNMGGYRGRGGYNNNNNNNNNRGMGMNNFGRGNYNSMGFQGGGGGFQGGFQGAPMGNMPYNNFNRGAMMGGMRGNGMRGRGGNMNHMGNNMGGNMGMNQMGMPMNQMGGMAMNPMAGGMNPMMGGMGGGNMGMQGQGFQGAQSPAFNQNYFQGAPAAAGNAGEASWNPHGAKRSRQE
ncbi:hypothetical protein N7495_009646 [Penicillium taxi]|uniref:uncharacterized protein n=1 Tax=Penicillium taxi TaxID=168475 RepID=UPI002545B41E|nr:uncharacterized protein N7495_009646 [Penicillium taxi]KAJ5885136.1 hypothetical protein N7495_009646 [Penicillium taxi]